MLFGLFWLTIPGFVGFGKIVYARAVGPLPQGEGWVSIPGYVNDDAAQNAIRMTKADQLDIALYALPVVLGGLCLTFGRLTAGAAPRNSGASGLFACSGLFTLLSLAGLVTAAACHKDRLNIPDVYQYAAIGFLILAGAAEFWFLTGLTASGLARRAPIGRAGGRNGWLHVRAGGGDPHRGLDGLHQPGVEAPAQPPERRLAALRTSRPLTLGWLLLIGVYWGAVRGVRVAISDWLSSGAA